MVLVDTLSLEFTRISEYRFGSCILRVQSWTSLKVAAYSISNGWTTPIDYFNLYVDTATPSIDSSFAGARTNYTTSYVDII